MNRLFFSLSMALMFLTLSCQYQDDLEPVSRRVIFHAYANENDTKTVLDDAGTHIYWEKGDAIRVYYGNKSSAFNSVLNENSPTADFEGFLYVDRTLQEQFWAVSPYSSAKGFDGEVLTVEIPNRQLPTMGSFDKKAFISVASSQDHVFHFMNVCGGIAFTVSREDVHSVTITGNNGEYLAGKVKVKFDAEGKPYIEDVLEGKKSVELKFNASGSEWYQYKIEPDAWYYIALLPQLLSSGFTFTYTIKPGVSYKVVYNEPVTIKRSVWGRLADATVTEPIVPIPDAAFKDFCVSNFDKNGDGEISILEAEEVQAIYCNYSYVRSVEGIKYFKNITNFNCENKRYLKSIDISGMQFLTESHLFLNDSLQFLNASNCPRLRSLECNNSKNEWKPGGLLESLDVSGDVELTNLVCSNNSLTILDISSCEKLSYLNCTGNPNLKELWMSPGQTVARLLYDNTVTTIRRTGPGDIILDRLTLNLVEGQSALLTTRIIGDYTGDVVLHWASSDDTIAEVSQEGLVTAVAEGKAIITVSTGNIMATCEVNVKRIPTGSDTGDIGIGTWKPGGEIRF